MRHGVGVQDAVRANSSPEAAHWHCAGCAVASSTAVGCSLFRASWDYDNPRHHMLKATLIFITLVWIQKWGNIHLALLTTVCWCWLLLSYRSGIFTSKVSQFWQTTEHMKVCICSYSCYLWGSFSDYAITVLRGWKSQNYYGWKRSSRWSPATNLTLLRVPLNHVLHYHIYMVFLTVSGMVSPPLAWAACSDVQPPFQWRNFS